MRRWQTKTGHKMNRARNQYNEKRAENVVKAIEKRIMETAYRFRHGEDKKPLVEEALLGLCQPFPLDLCHIGLSAYSAG
jgi:hypothetical protein